MKTFSANYYSEITDGECSRPDAFVQEGKSFVFPDFDFVISRNKSGDAISTFKNDTWDLRPYGLTGSQGRLMFANVSKENRLDAKWVIFILMYFSDSGRASVLSANTLVGYMKLVRDLDSF